MTMSDDAVKAKTGRDWRGWFSTLDKEGAAKLQHRNIADLLAGKYELSGWWSQCVTVEYELARGLRERHETADGFSVSATKTIAASVADVYLACADAAKRKAWFPRGAFTVSSQTRNKYLNGAWKKTARLNIGLYAKGAGKAQIAVQVSKLGDKEAVERERMAWRAALAKLQAQLEAP
jgi:hypothetical protein